MATKRALPRIPASSRPRVSKTKETANQAAIKKSLENEQLQTLFSQLTEIASSVHVLSKATAVNRELLLRTYTAFSMQAFPNTDVWDPNGLCDRVCRFLWNYGTNAVGRTRKLSVDNKLHVTTRSLLSVRWGLLFLMVSYSSYADVAVRAEWAGETYKQIRAIQALYDIPRGKASERKVLGVLEVSYLIQEVLTDPIDATNAIQRALLLVQFLLIGHRPGSVLKDRIYKENVFKFQNIQLIREGPAASMDFSVIVVLDTFKGFREYDKVTVRYWVRSSRNPENIHLDYPLLLIVWALRIGAFRDHSSLESFLKGEERHVEWKEEFKEKPVFRNTSPRGFGITEEPMSFLSWSGWFKNLLQKAGFSDEGISAYSFRYHYAQTLKGMEDANDVRRAMGHRVESHTLENHYDRGNESIDFTGRILGEQVQDKVIIKMRESVAAYRLPEEKRKMNAIPLHEAIDIDEHLKSLVELRDKLMGLLEKREEGEEEEADEEAWKQYLACTSYLRDGDVVDDSMTLQAYAIAIDCAVRKRYQLVKRRIYRETLYAACEELKQKMTLADYDSAIRSGSQVASQVIQMVINQAREVTAPESQGDNNAEGFVAVEELPYNLDRPGDQDETDLQDKLGAQRKAFLKGLVDLQSAPKKQIYCDKCLVNPYMPAVYRQGAFKDPSRLKDHQNSLLHKYQAAHNLYFFIRLNVQGNQEMYNETTHWWKCLYCLGGFRFKPLVLHLDDEHVKKEDTKLPPELAGLVRAAAAEVRSLPNEEAKIISPSFVSLKSREQKVARESWPFLEDLTKDKIFDFASISSPSQMERSARDFRNDWLIQRVGEACPRDFLHTAAEIARAREIPVPEMFI